MRPIRIMIGSILMLALLGAALGVAAARHADPQTGAPGAGAAVPAFQPAAATPPPPPSPPATDPDLARASRPEGVPAITPRRQGVPAFGPDDVRAYLAEKGVGMGKIQLRQGGSWQISNIESTTTLQARTLRNVRVDVPETRVLCLVTITGDFVVHGPPVPRGEPGSNIMPVPGIIQIYDATTGNLLGQDSLH